VLTLEFETGEEWSVAKKMFDVGQMGAVTCRLEVYVLGKSATASHGKLRGPLTLAFNQE
jgi:hypothetical protein